MYFPPVFQVSLLREDKFTYALVSLKPSVLK